MMDGMGVYYVQSFTTVWFCSLSFGTTEYKYLKIEEHVRKWKNLVYSEMKEHIQDIYFLPYFLGSMGLVDTKQRPIEDKKWWDESYI